MCPDNESKTRDPHSRIEETEKVVEPAGDRGINKHLVYNGGVLILIMATTSRWLRVPILFVAPLVLATVLQAYAIGLAMGGLVIIYKRLEALYQVGNLVLVALIVAPTGSPLVKFLPFNVAVRLLYQVMSAGKPLIALSREILQGPGPRFASCRLRGGKRSKHLGKAGKRRGPANVKDPRFITLAEGLVRAPPA